MKIRFFLKAWAICLGFSFPAKAKLLEYRNGEGRILILQCFL